MYSYAVVSLVSLLDNGIIQSAIRFYDTDIRFSDLKPVSAPFLVFFTYGTPAKWDQPQSHLAKQIFIYLYIYMCVCVFIYIYILYINVYKSISPIHYILTNNRCCF